MLYIPLLNTFGEHSSVPLILLSWTVLNGPRSRSQWLFLEKCCHCSSALFMDQFWFNLPQMWSMTISWTILSLRVLGPGSRSQWLFLEKNIVIALGPSFMDWFRCNFIQVFSMKNILIKFKFQLSRAKVNVKVTVLRNMLSAVRCFHLWTDFDVTSYKF